ncbi:phosphoethanolamine transferase [Campylobacter sp. MIT 99-7217]|uniref:phosphoethanolamine transferase n=1 Tax=Campylobacter sp. MIT 99-7217 TaxID=535091 RepID=UPI003917B6F1
MSWFYFVLFSALYLTAMNFVLFEFIFSRLEDKGFFYYIIFILLHFFILVAVFSVFFLPFVAKFLMIIFVLIASASSYFMMKYGVIIDHLMIRNIFRTDIKEVSELSSFSMVFWIFLFGLLPCFCLLKTKIVYGSLKKHLALRLSMFLISLLIIAAIFLPMTSFFVSFFRNNYEAEFYTTPFYQIKSFIKFSKEDLLPKKELQSIAKDAVLSPNLQKKILILIVGETARAANYSLGDYSRNLTNEFTPDEGVVFFENFYSCGTATAKSVPCMFSSSKAKTHSNSEYAENVLDILQRLGVKVTWLGNNSGGCQGVCDRLINVRKFSNEFDGFLIDEVKKELESLENMELVVVHLQGSHGPTYYKRYPKEFRKFTPTCDTNELQKCTEEELINTYDNTILYTDHVVEEIIDEAKLHTEFLSSVIYVSDHGESLGENGVYLHGMPYLLAPKFQTHIPLVFWSNDLSLNQNAFSKKHLKLSHDNLFSSLLGFFGVQTSLYEQEYDLFSQELKPNLD